MSSKYPDLYENIDKKADCDRHNSYEELKELLDLTVARFNTPAFIEEDPVQFPHRYTLKQDIEISAFLTATIAWGKRSLILKSASKIHAIMGESPYDYVMSKGFEQLGRANIHRTFFEEDMHWLCRGLHALYQEYESAETLFCFSPENEGGIWNGIRNFREYIQDAHGKKESKSAKHISNPLSSACKRLHLALRWLVRNDGIVDLGVWKNISPAELQIPLDVHVAHTARKFGLLKGKQNDRKAVEELTANLKSFNSKDPVIYDFALFGLGVQPLVP